MTATARYSGVDGSVGHKSITNGSERVNWKGLKKYYSNTKMSTLNGILKRLNLRRIAREKQKLYGKSALYEGVNP
jgi:hypothetical protein